MFKSICVHLMFNQDLMFDRIVFDPFLMNCKQTADLLLVSISPFFEYFSNASKLNSVVLSVTKPASIFSILLASSLEQLMPLVQNTPLAPITLKLRKNVKSILKNSICQFVNVQT